MTTLDHRSPLVLDTRELGRRPGSLRTVRRTVEAPADLGTAVVGVAEGSPVELDLRLEAVMEGVLVSGTARATSTGECVRCLDPVERELVVDLQELYTYPGRAPEDDPDGTQDDLHELDGDLVDVEPVLRDAVVLALPFQPVCSPDCPGLCADCGVRLADAEPGHQHDSVDPRWAALQSMASDRGQRTEED
ncbi:DUF177 domain-containing protein [uncultured Pseudokineococcus sp.]|uniref:YceD family protein n=1 Tax=uncultured Pseudokineococcus sp. TaxID=1642928 RepID=UPI002615C6B7|nr:YceD family protein [uncultured Pseudokineococcus sp.]